MSGAPALLRPPPVVRHESLAPYASVRVTGVLTSDAQFFPTLGREPHRLMVLEFKPARGLPYYARIDFGTDVADHMAAEVELTRLRRGALVSVGGDALQLCRDHGHELLRVINPRDLVVA